MPQISAVFHQVSSDTWCRSAGRSVGEIIPTAVPSSPTTTSARPARRINSATSARGILSGTTSPGSTALIAPATSPSPLRPVTRPTTPPADTTGTAPAPPVTAASRRRPLPRPRGGARVTPPPSSGNPGRRLKIAIPALTNASWRATPARPAASGSTPDIPQDAIANPPGPPERPGSRPQPHRRVDLGVERGDFAPGETEDGGRGDHRTVVGAQGGRGEGQSHAGGGALIGEV